MYPWNEEQDRGHGSWISKNNPGVTNTYPLNAEQESRAHYESEVGHQASMRCKWLPLESSPENEILRRQTSLNVPVSRTKQISSCPILN